MEDFIGFVRQNMLFGCLMTVLNIIIAQILIRKINIYSNRLLREAMGRRWENSSLIKRGIYVLNHAIDLREGRGVRQDAYLHAASKMKKCGYLGRYAALIYLILKYVVPILIFILIFAISCPDILKPAAISVMTLIMVEIVVTSNRKKICRIYQKNTYKIYKYLHNQVSAGIKVTDAIKTVHEVVSDDILKEALILLVAEFELTKNIDKALDEFRSRFDTPDSETLCVALRQGVITGDNSELLARQEDLMFKRYFNYMQTETDNCKIKNAMVVALFSLIVVIMITVPLLKDVSEAAGKIFI
jgi:Flp pilus assembly protein TadB